MLKSIHRDLLQWWKGPNKKYFCGMLGLAVVVYFPLISQRLVNTFDGLWNGSWFIGGFWEISIGRWLWPVADFVRFGVQTEPLNSLLTLAMVVLSMTIIRKIFVQNDGLMSWLAGMIFVSGAVVGVWLSYRYMSPIFGLSLLMAVLAAECVIRLKCTRNAVFSGAVILALSLGLYQANLACFCMILLSYLLLLLFQEAERSRIYDHIVRSLGSALAGMMLYWLVLKAILIIGNLQLADYNGAADLSVKSILMGIPKGILQAYQLFGLYFFGNQYRHNMLQTVGLFGIVLVVFGIKIFWHLWKLANDKKYENLFFGVMALAVMPIACNAMMLISSEAVWRMQMGGGLALFVPLCILLLEGTQPKKSESDRKSRWLVVLLAILVVYGNVYMMAVDQEAMRQGRDSMSVMSNRIVNDLMDEAYFDEEEQVSVMFVGRPSSNPTFKKGDLYLAANKYAQMGCFWLQPECARLSWRGVFEKITPVNLNLCEDATYQQLRETEVVAQMPVYPQEGYIQRVGDVIIVKVSDDYMIDEEMEG